MKIDIVIPDEYEYYRLYSVELPDDITAPDLLREFQKLMVMIGYAVESVNEAFREVLEL